MKKEEKITLGEESLKKEKEIIKKIVLSGVENKNVEFRKLQEEFKKVYEETNRIVGEYFEEDYEKEEMLEGYFGELIRECISYQEMQTLGEKDSLDEYLDYLRKKIDFFYENNQASEILEMMLWYWEEEGKKNPEEVLERFLEDKKNLISLRNTISGNQIEGEITNEELDVLENREFLHILMKMDLTHQFFMKAQDSLIAVFERDDAKEVIESSILYLTLITAVYQNLCRKYKIEEGEKSLLEGVIEDSIKPFFILPEITSNIELLEEFMTTENRAKALSDKYLEQIHK